MQTRGSPAYSPTRLLAYKGLTELLGRGSVSVQRLGAGRANRRGSLAYSPTGLLRLTELLGEDECDLGLALAHNELAEGRFLHLLHELAWVGST